MSASTSLLAGLLSATSNGVIYSYSMYSTRIARELQITPSQVVILGVLLQTGLGAFQVPVTLGLERATRKGVSSASQDFFLGLVGGFSFVAAMLALGVILQNAERGVVIPNAYSTACFLMLLFGFAVGSTFLNVVAVVNFNFQVGRNRKRAVASISLAVGVGALLSVLTYQFLLLDVALSMLFYGLAAWYFVVSAIRVGFLKRVKMKNVELDTPSESMGESVVLDDLSPTPLAPISEQPEQHVGVVADEATPISFRTLLSNKIVVLTCVSTYFGIGIAGTFLASIGNLATHLTADLGEQPRLDATFNLTIAFLVRPRVLCRAD
jgi:hypothetical protein